MRFMLVPWLLMASAFPSHADVTLVVDGKAQVVIVVPEKASQTLRFAAAELQTHLKLMSGDCSRSFRDRARPGGRPLCWAAPRPIRPCRETV